LRGKTVLARKKQHTSPTLSLFGGQAAYRTTGVIYIVSVSFDDYF
jgi:hypothetical protein